MAEVDIISNRTVNSGKPIVSSRYVLVKGETSDGRYLEAVGKSRLSESRALDDAIENLEKLAENGPNISYSITSFTDSDFKFKHDDVTGSESIRQMSRGGLLQIPKVKTEIVANNQEVDTEATGKVYFDFLKFIPKVGKGSAYNATLEAMNKVKKRSEKLA